MTHFTNMLPTLLARLIPPRQDDESAQQYDARTEIAREEFEAFGARDPIERMLALQAVAAHYAAMDAHNTAIQPNTDLAAVRRSRADATRMGREMREVMKTIERRRTPDAPQKPKTAEQPMHREPEPEEEEREVIELAPDLTEERLGGYAKRRRILDSDPVQAFWTTHHPIEVDIHVAWSNAIRKGLAVVDAEDAGNRATSHAP